MQRISLSALFVAMAVAVAMAADKTIMDGQIEVKITEKGGGLTLTAKAMNDEDDDKDNGGSDKDDATTAEPEATTTAEPAGDGAGDSEDNTGNRKRRAAEESKDNVVEIMLNSLKEVDDKGKEVGTTKKEKQNVGDFEAVTFTIADAEDSTIPNSKNSKNEKIKARKIAYEASVGTGGGKVKINVYIAKEAGNITLGPEDNTEETMVEKGQIKFTVQIEGWVWCTEADANCVVEETKEEGASLDLAITVKGEGKATLNDAGDGMAPSYDIGNKNMLYVSNMVQKTATNGDKSWEEMAATYPMAEDKEDGKTQMTMRFPKFEESIWYDPSVRLAIPGGEGVSSSNMITASLAVVMLTVLAAFIRL